MTEIMVENQVIVVSPDEIAITVAPVEESFVVTVSGLGEQGPRGIQGIPGVPAPSLNPLAWSRGGTQFVSTGGHRYYVDHPGTDMGLRATLSSPPVGADLVVALRQNGAVIQLATIPEGQITSGYLTLVPGTVSAGDYFSVDVTQVGSTVPGDDLTVTLWMRVTP